MKRVTGLGGVFFKSEDPRNLKKWYSDHLGFQVTEWGAPFFWGYSDGTSLLPGRTEWSPFKSDTTYFAPGEQEFMINYRVHDLANLMNALKEEQVTVVGDIDQTPYGNFGWILDPENRKVELWEPGEDPFGSAPNEKVTGLGGVFFKSRDPKMVKSWYAKHLGVGETFTWTDLNNRDRSVPAKTVWAPFNDDTTYFAPAKKTFMFNYRVKDLGSLLQTLAQHDIKRIGETEEYSYGKFAWVMDPEGNKVELWEPRDE